MIRYKEMPFIDLTDQFKGYLHKNLTLSGDRNNSVMKGVLEGYVGTPENISVSIAYDGSTPIGWCLAETLGRTPSSGTHVMTFVSEDYRRKGIGSELVRRVSKYIRRKKIRCFMWDHNSTQFYVALGANKVENPRGYLRFIPQGEVKI